MKKTYLLVLGLICLILIVLSENVGHLFPDEEPMAAQLQWSEDILLTTNPLEDRSPSFLKHAEGTIWLMWVTETYTGNDILYKTFDGKWSKGLRVTQSPLDDNSPSVLQDAEGTIWVVWTSSRDRDWEIYYKTFDGSWSDDTRLTENPGEDKDPSISQDSTGTIWVVWSSLDEGNYEIYYKTFDGAWSEAENLTESPGDDFGPAIFQDAEGTIWLVWRSMVVDNWEIHFKTFDGTWSEEKQLYTGRQTAMGYSILLDKSGTIWFFWDSLHEDNYDIFYKTFNGEWSDEGQLTTAPGHDHSPSLMQDAEGTIWVAWDSERIFGNKDIYYKTFNGQWSDDRQLTEYTGNDWSPRILQDNTGTFWLFWISERDGNRDIYYKTGAPPVPLLLRQNVLVTLAVIGAFFSSLYGWYRRFPISFNQFAHLITRGKFVPFTRIDPNPYIAGNPIKSKEMFFGREDVFEYLDTKLRPELDVTVVLHGQRRTGKTSILYQIKEGRLGSQFIPVYIDFQAIPSGSYKEFLHQVAKFMGEALEHWKPESSSPLREFFEIKWRDKTDPHLVFGEFLDNCSDLAGGKSFLILFDEFELFVAMVKDDQAKNNLHEDHWTEDGGTLRHKMRGFFRNWMQHRGGFSFIFAGTRALEKIEPFWALLFDSALYRKISRLKKEDALALMKKPVLGLIHYDTEAREEIIRLTRCNPYLLQLMLQNLVDRVNKKVNYRITLEDVQEIVSDLMVNTPPLFNNLWEDSEDRQKKVLSAVASFPIESAEIPRKGLYEKLSQVDLEEVEIRETLEELVDNDILEVLKSKNIYLFELELFRHWIAFNHPFSGIQEGM